MIKPILLIIAAVLLLPGCANPSMGGGYGLAHLDEDYDGFSFTTDIVYVEAIIQAETKIPFCPKAELGTIAEKSINGDVIKRYEVNAGCSFAVFW